MSRAFLNELLEQADQITRQVPSGMTAWVEGEAHHLTPVVGSVAQCPNCARGVVIESISSFETRCQQCGDLLFITPLDQSL